MNQAQVQTVRCVGRFLGYEFFVDAARRLEIGETEMREAQKPESLLVIRGKLERTVKTVASLFHLVFLQILAPTGNQGFEVVGVAARRGGFRHGWHIRRWPLPHVKLAYCCKRPASTYL